MGATDVEHLDRAFAQRRVIVTEDLDFRRLHDHGHQHAGIAYFHGGRRSIGEIVEMLTLLHASMTAEEMIGRLEWL